MKNTKRVITLSAILFFLFSVSMLFPESDIYDRIGIIAEHGLHGAVPEENIDLFTGNLTLRFKDIVLPGPNGFDLVIWRVYNSKILKDRIPGSAWGIQQEPYSWVGLGWSIHMGRVHNFNSNEPVIEFPDGRWETAYPDKNGSNYITRGFLKYNKSTYKLYFKDGTVWTFGEQKTLTYVGYTEQVRVVTKITNSYGHTINVEYDSSSPNITKITDSMGRTVNFITNTSTNPKLNKITVRNATGGYCYYYYTVDAYSSWGGYYRLKKFDPPELPASTYEYYSGSDKYEIKTVNTSYGGRMSYEYDNHTFYFQVQPLDTRVVTKKSINSSNWFYTYPSYYNASTGTVNINGPVYNTSVIYNAYSSQSPWKIGLIKDKLFSDSSYSESYAWEPQVISNTRWYVLNVDMGPATAALLSQISKNIKGDSDLSETYLYERPSPKNYGLPTKIKYYTNGNLKNYKRIYYYYENNSTFASKYMLNYIKENKIYNSSNVKLKETLTDYYTTSGKCGAIDRIRRWNGSSYLTWDYTYYSSNPNNINVTINLPGSGGTETYKYSYGILSKFDRPGFTELSRTISSYNSAIKTETNRYGGTMSFDYDNLNRIKKINMPSSFNDIDVTWYTNSVSITQAGNTVVKYWDSMGRDLGYREAGDGITLYYRKTLDSEGRVVSESKGSTSSSDKYYYQLTAAGQVKKITDPREKVTTISYSGDQKTLTDPNENQTKFEYDHLPGLVTKLTDAKNKVATYTYDGIGRLRQVKYNNSRTQDYYYNGLDQITSESHPETGNISYSYNSAGNLYKKSWSGTTLTYTYNSSNQLTKLDSGDEIINYYYSYGNLSSISSNNGWTRDQISYNSLGSVIKERQTISGLSGYKTLIYTHSGNNNLKSITYPDGRIVNYTNNGLNMPETVKFNNKSLVSQIAYSINKQPNSMNLSGNGTIFSASYNKTGFLSSTSFKKGGTTHYRANYGYDNVGNITSIYNTVPGLNSSFSYDNLYRIQSATYSGASNFSYTFDTYGNMLTVKKDNITVLNRSYTSKNQVNGFGYDTHGNLTSAVGFSYNWDNQNRLTTVRMNSEVIANNTYNERGLRLKASRLLHPTISITSPNGGENWEYGTIQNITWTSTGIVGNVNIEYSTDNGTNYTSIVESTENDGIYEWTVPDDVSSNCLVRISETDGQPSDVCDEVFSIFTPSITITSPNGGDIWGIGSNQNITWSSTGTVGNVKIEYSTDNGSNYTSIVESTENDGTYQWTIPDDVSSNCLVRISETDGEPSDVSDEVFSIFTPSITITSPNGGEALKIETSYNITWSSLGLVSNIRLRLFKNSSEIGIIAEDIPISSESYFWTVGSYQGGMVQAGIGYVIKIETMEGYYATDESDSSFEIINWVDITSPNEGEDWPLGLTRDIVWNSVGITSDIKLILIRGTNEIGTIADNVPISSSFYSWTVGDINGSQVEPGMNYKIKIETTNGQFSDESDNFFNLSGQDDHGISVIQTNDDGYVFVGYSNSFTHGGYDFLTYKLDANGNKQWRKNFGGLYPDTAHSIQQTADNGFIVAGETKSFVHGTIGEDSDFLVYKLDANGNKQWRKNFGGLYPDTAHSIQQTADNGFIVAGETKSFVHGTIGEDSDFLIYKLDDGGNKQWRKNYGGGEIWETTGQSYAPTNSLEKGKNNKNGEHKDSLQNDAFPPYNSNQGGPFVGDVLNSTSNTSIINKKTSKSGISNPKLKTSSKTRKILSEPLYNTYYIYSYDGKLMAEYDHNGNCVKDYIYVGNKLLAEYQPQTGKYYYYMNDQINSTRIVTDDAGNVAYSAIHGPFGGAQKTWINTYDPRLKYSGKEREGYSDLDYFGARYYDHNSYRFISVDPIINKEEALTNPQLWNLYAYCRNNPITYLDPDGREDDRKPKTNKKRIMINLDKQTLKAYKKKKIVFDFKVVTGDKDHPTDKGEFKIFRKEHPYRSKKYDVKMDYAMFFTKDGKAIHQYHGALGLGVIRTLRKLSRFFGSHGCVRLKKSDAKGLYKWTPVGTAVEVY